MSSTDDGTNEGNVNPGSNSIMMYRSLLKRCCVLIAVFVISSLMLSRVMAQLQKSLHSPPLRPNIVMIVTDDQDSRMESMSYMPFLQKHLIEKGTSYRHHFCTVALCCPSRVNMWTGKAAHNTNVTDISPPYGGYPKFVQQGLNEAYLPVWLQAVGYATYYVGKLFNAHTVDNYNDPYPAGFNGTDFLLDPYTYSYLNSTFQRNREPPKSYEGQYNTDIVTEKSLAFLEEAAKSKDPFFLVIAPIAPHTDMSWDESQPLEYDAEIRAAPPVPAKRHQHLFNEEIVPRTPNFNPENPSGVGWIRKLPRQDAKNVKDNDDLYRNRLRALQSVDEMIDQLFNKLNAYKILDDTIVVYTSDNGFHVGQHRLQPGKECAIEEDINVPFIVRGRGIPYASSYDGATSHTDIVPTILKVAGAPMPDDLDGVPIPLLASELMDSQHKPNEHVNIEYWGWALNEGLHGERLTWDNTYKSVRLISKVYNLQYSVWCTGDHELYDLKTDPYQLNNLYTFDQQLPESPYHRIASRLDALLMVLKSCRGSACVDPWRVLHPQGTVESLADALSAEHDVYYETELNRVSFSSCEAGYIVEAEGPQSPWPLKAYPFD